MTEDNLFKIAILGAGPAGCTLARLLLHKKLPVQVVVFEGEKSLNARVQGGTLDLHTDTGIEAIKQCGLHNEFLKFARFDGEAFRICNKRLQSYLYMAGTQNEKSSRGRPEIDRLQLRRLLIDSLPEGVIRWDHHLSRVEESDGQYYLHFRDRPAESGFDLIVGADGAWSHVRSILTTDKPYYSGISGVSLEIENPKEEHPDLYARVERGSFAVFDDRKSIWAQQLGSGNINVSYWSIHDESWVERFNGRSDDIEYMKQACLEELEGWDPRILAFIKAANFKPVSRNLFMLPVGNTWIHKAGLTLLGDAAHVFTPFAGEGVNLAMTDALRLAEFIEAACDDGSSQTLDKQVQGYETQMFKRAHLYQSKTQGMMNAGFAKDFDIETYVMRAIADDMPRIFTPVLRIALFCYYSLWRWWYQPSKKDKNV